MLPAGTQLAAGRVALGVGSMVAPELVGKAFGLNLATSPDAGIFARFFATREIMLGAAVLAGGPGAKGFAIKAGIAVDAGDAIGAILEQRAGRLTQGKSAVLAAVALGAVGLGVLALSE